MTLQEVGFVFFCGFSCLTGCYFTGICFIFITLCEINYSYRFDYHFLELVPKYESLWQLLRSHI